jgi:hypothetical protein
MSLLRVYDLDGKELRRRRLWYTSDSDSTTLIPRGDEMLILNRSNTVARLNALGEITLSRLDVPVLHARAASLDGKRIALGLRGGVRVWTDKTQDQPFDEPPGEAEFVTRLLVRPDGTIYGVTSAYRVVHIDPTGKVRTVPVF